MTGCEQGSSLRATVEAQLALVEQEIFDLQTPSAKARVLQNELDKQSQAIETRRRQAGEARQKLCTQRDLGSKLHLVCVMSNGTLW